MKFILLAWTLAASVVSGGAIGVTGSGQFYFPNPAISWIRLSGSDGVNFVSADCYVSSTSLYGCGVGSASNLGAYIDGEHFSPGFFSVALNGDWGSSITGYDRSMQPVMSQEISTYIQVTSVTCGGPGFGQECVQAFNIVSNPEPGTWLLVAGGLALLGWRAKYVSGRRDP